MNFLKYWRHYFYNQLPWNKVRFQPLSLSDEELQSLRKKVNQRMKKFENIKKKSTVAQSQLKQSVTSGKSLIDEAISAKNTTFLSYLQLPTIPSAYSYLPSFTTTTKKETEVNKVKPVIVLSRQKVDERTIKLVNNLKLYATTDPGHVRRLQDLCKHLSEYPEARGVALQNEAIGQILSILSRSKENMATKLQANEALAELGYQKPLHGKGIRILAIDGGGMRGIIGVQMLKNLEKETGKEIHELFDFIVGVSTGAIIASFLGFHKKSMKEVEEIYKEIGSKIFTQSQIDGTIGYIRSHSFYNTKMYEEILKGFVGEFPMNGLNRCYHATPKVAIISSHVTEQRITPYVFRSYTLPYLVHSSFKGSCKYPVWAAVRASSAAPGYFDEFSLDNDIHHDGGILVNNATHIGIHEARRLWPNEKLHCVVSLGLGRHELPLETNESTTKPLSLGQKFSRIVDSATDTELVHETLTDNLEKDVYYRFNPYLPEYLPLDEKRPEKMTLMAEAADMYLRRNRKKFQNACKTLTEHRSPLKMASDHFNCQLEIIRSKLY